MEELNLMSRNHAETTAPPEPLLVPDDDDDDGGGDDDDELSGKVAMSLQLAI